MTQELRLELDGDDFCIDAALLGGLLDVPAADVQALMRTNDITSRCERGIAEHDGQYRLTFFYKGRRARLSVDQSGRIIRRSIVDYGNLPLPPAAHRTGGR